MTLNGMSVVITGGAKGLGKSMAVLLAQKGAKVCVCDTDEKELNAVSSNTGITGIPADVRKESDLQKVSKKVIEMNGHIDLWINNAGVWMPKEEMESLSLEKARNLFDINVFGTMNGVRTALSHMKLKKKGTIMNIISTTAFDGMNGSSGSIYVASKYALRGLTNVIREEVKTFGIKIIGAYPGGIKTDLFKEAKPETIGQFMNPDDVAEKIIANLELETPVEELIIARPGQTIPHERS